MWSPQKLQNCFETLNGIALARDEYQPNSNFLAPTYSYHYLFNIFVVLHGSYYREVPGHLAVIAPERRGKGKPLSYGDCRREQTIARVLRLSQLSHQCPEPSPSTVSTIFSSSGGLVALR